MKFYIETVGCQMNTLDSVYSALGRLKHWKAQKPGSLIAVMGCMAQKDQTKIFTRAPYVDIVCGPGQIDRLTALVAAAAATGAQQIAVGVNRFENKNNPHAVRDSFRLFDPKRLAEARPRVFQAMVRIMFGCNKFCSYCIVPSVRGPEQSRPPKDILNEFTTMRRTSSKQTLKASSKSSCWVRRSTATVTSRAKRRPVSPICSWKSIRYPVFAACGS